MAEGQGSMGELTNEPLATYAEWHAEQEQQDAQARQAAYDYRDAGLQYGGGRSLHAPDGRYAGVHYHYHCQAPARQRSRAQYGRRGVSRGNTLRPSSRGQRDASYDPWAKSSDMGFQQRSGSFLGNLLELWWAFWYGR